MDNLCKKTIEIAVIATMSSGKSTLINAILGTDIIPVKNQACTSKISKIRNINNQPIFSVKAYDKSNQLLESHDVATKELLKRMNEDDHIHWTCIEGNLPNLHADSMNLVLIDTPGPNNSQDLSHSEKTMSIIKDDTYKPLVLYILNATQLGINDDRHLLTMIRDEMNNKDKQSKDRFIFVLNKIDGIDIEKESVEMVIDNARQYLESHGIMNPNIYPASSNIAKNIRKKLNGVELTRKELRDLYSDIDCFIECEDLHLLKYTPLNEKQKERLTSDLEQFKAMNSEDGDLLQALYHSGVPYIEEAINEYLDKYVLMSKPQQLKKKLNKEIVFVTTMSLGKSTLINAILGTDILPSKNWACTTKISKIRNVSDQSIFSVKAYDKSNRLLESHDVATEELLKRMNQDDNIYWTCLEGSLPNINGDSMNLALIDTPSPHYCYMSHYEKIIEAIKDDINKPLVVYILYAAHLGVVDDRHLLKMIGNEMKSKGKQSNDRFIFVLNKIDLINAEHEAVEMEINNARQYLESNGIIEPKIYPASSILAKNIRKKLNGVELTRKELRDLQSDVDYFIESEPLHLLKYTPLNQKQKERLTSDLERFKAMDSEEGDLLQALYHSGVPYIEEAINESLNKDLLIFKTQEIKGEISKKILVLATMSAGKSTLLNALIGEDILPSSNEACTAKVIKYTGNNSLSMIYSDNGVEEILRDDIIRLNQNSKVSELNLMGPIKSNLLNDMTIQYIDTPGVNNSQDESHGVLTDRTLQVGDFDTILYVLNATQLGITDDALLLLKLKKYLKSNPEKKVVFALNKIDEFDFEKESVEELVQTATNYIKKNTGIKNPCVIGVSAFYANLMHKKINQQLMTRKERLELNNFISDVDEYGLGYEQYHNLEELSSHDKYTGELVYLYKTGLINLEKALYWLRDK